MTTVAYPSPRALALARNRPLLVGGALLVALTAVALLAPVVATHSPTATSAQRVLLPPSGSALFGTDSFGRDIFSRVVYAARYDLGIAVVATAIAALLGSAIGAMLGYFGGVLDHVAMRFLEIVQAFPSMILALLLVATLGSGIPIVIAVIAFLNVPIYVRIVRAEFQVHRTLEYVDAARAIGIAPMRIVFRHIFPNVTAPVIAYLPINAVFAIVVAAGLGFLGLGVRAPAPEWGLLIAAGAQDVISGQWWTSFFPGSALVVASLAFYLIGDGLEQRADR